MLTEHIFMKQMFIMKSGVLSLVAAYLSCCSGHPRSNDELKCRVIYQPFIPAVGGRRPFLTKKDALNTGKLVCRRLAEGQSPALSREDVEACLTDTGVLRDRQ